MTTNPIPLPVDPDHAAHLQSVTEGFDRIFSNDIQQARQIFENKKDPYHFLGLAVCGFLEAALGMESAVMADATKSLSAAHALAKTQLQAVNKEQTTRFTPGLEYEVLVADATVLSALINILRETFFGYLKGAYALNSAHAKFTKLYQTVFPNGINSHDTPLQFEPEGPLEELIVSGVAFGHGVFNLVLGILPSGVQRAISVIGYKYDLGSGIAALSLAAAKNDPHSVFATLVLLMYMGLVLQMTGWQACAKEMEKKYLALLDPMCARYPTGNLWTLHHAKWLRSVNQQEEAIAILREGSKPGRPYEFKQADVLLVYELGWTLVGERRYHEAAEMFMRMKELNSWSHATYHFLAAGCYISIGKLDEAQSLLDGIPNLASKKVAGGRPPTEVFIEKKIKFYKEKQGRRREAHFVESVNIGLAEELAIFWNNHAYVSPSSAQAHIDTLLKLTPGVDLSPAETKGGPISLAEKTIDLDTPDELAVRSLLLGIFYRTLGDYANARRHLTESYAIHPKVKVSTWVGGIAMFEMATLDLKEMEASCTRNNADDDKAEKGDEHWEKQDEEFSPGAAGGPGFDTRATQKQDWEHVLREAEKKLDTAIALSPREVDLSSRLDSRISMLKEEIRKKRAID